MREYWVMRRFLYLRHRCSIAQDAVRASSTARGRKPKAKTSADPWLLMTTARARSASRRYSAGGPPPLESAITATREACRLGEQVAEFLVQILAHLREAF